LNNIYSSDIWIKNKKYFYSILDKFINISMQEKLVFFFVTININENSKLKYVNQFIVEFKKPKYQISWLYLVEENENQVHYHFIMGVKSILEYNEHLKINLLNELKESLT
jgi:hypothetical protein